MKKFRYFKLILLTLALILLFGCGVGSDSVEETEESTDSAETIEEESNEETDSSESSGGELKVAYSAQPANLDPHGGIVTATADIMGHVYETLLTFDSEYNVQPMLADSYDVSDDGKVITFHLREGVLFHNGEEMIAEDVVASMNRWIESPSSRENFVGAKFEEVDDYTVELILPEEYSTAISALAHGGAGLAGIMPKEVAEGAGSDIVEEYVGTGPFEFVEWKQDQHVLLKKFDDYQSREEPSDGLAGKKEALIDELYFLFITDSSTRVAGIQSGEYDIAHAVPYDSVEQLQSDEAIENHVYPGGYISVYFNKKEGLFTDFDARQAVNLALDKVDVLTGGYSFDDYFISNSNIMMDHQKQWNSDVGKDRQDYTNVDEAKELLDQVGYDGEEVRLIVTRDYEDQYNAGIVIQEQLEAAGFNINLEVYDWPTFLDLREDENEWDLHVMANTEVPEPLSTIFLKSNVSGWVDSPELDEILEEFKSQPTVEEAMDVYDDLLEWYWDYLPIVKIGDYYRVAAVRDSVSEFKYQSGFIFWNVTNDR